MLPIPVPSMFEAKLSDAEFHKIGQFACRWAFIEETIANCLRVILGMEPEVATIMIFPLTLESKMRRIDDLRELNQLTDYQNALFDELTPLIKAIQFIRNTMLHGTVPHVANPDAAFRLRSKGRLLAKDDLFGSENLINYTTHVTLAFRLSLGQFSTEETWGPTYALPSRPPIPPFLPPDCQKRLPPEKEALLIRA